ncbi:MAG: hypothetical protein FJW30_04075 [Acidobacteria bacterium]|nr:hypothetical protein [Acidobacteriota bacterium]
MTALDEAGSPVFTVTKKGRLLELPRDTHPQSDRYMAIEAPGMLVLFANEDNGPVLAENEAAAPAGHPRHEPDRDAQLRRAFTALSSRVSSSAWTSSDQPYTVLMTAFDDLYAQTDVRADVSSYLGRNPSVGSAVEMLFTSIAMSARADWRATPVSVRGVAARGWFLGRWIPTFLVLDGPIMRFLNSEAFRRQTGSAVPLRAVRAFFSNRDFMLLRHAFAHWSFSWRTDGNDSEILALGRSPDEEVRVSRAEADAFHIITFALVEAVHDVFLEGRRTRR